MQKTISNTPVKIQIAKLVTVLIFVASMSYVYAERQGEIDKIITIHEQRLTNVEQSKGILNEGDHATRISLLEKEIGTIRDYSYTIKSDLKKEINEFKEETKEDNKLLQEKIDKIYDFIIRG